LHLDPARRFKGLAALPIRLDVLLPVLVLVCVALVPLLGGRLSALADLTLRRGGLALAALALQVLIISVIPDRLEGLHAPVHLLTYVLAGAVAWANRSVPGVPLIALGGLLNGAAIFANGGIMPASPDALATAGLAVGAPGTYANSDALADPRLAFLGDVFAIPAGWPLANVFSVGDVAIVLGVALCLHRVCGSRLGALRFPRRRRVAAGSR
jgi:hypothetical protein